MPTLGAWMNLESDWYPLLTVSGEKLSRGESVIQPFMKRLKEKVEEPHLLPDQMYNADESGFMPCFQEYLSVNLLPELMEQSCHERSI